MSVTWLVGELTSERLNSSHRLSSPIEVLTPFRIGVEAAPMLNGEDQSSQADVAQLRQKLVALALLLLVGNETPHLLYFL